MLQARTSVASIILGLLALAVSGARAEVVVNTYTADTQWGPGVAGNAAGNVVVAWSSEGQDGSGYGIFGQRYDSAGTPVGSAFPVNTFTPGDQVYPRVALNGAGRFLVVWLTWGSNRIAGRAFDAAGTPLGTEFEVSSASSGGGPAIVAQPSGSFVVAWDGLAQRYDDGGVPLGAFATPNTGRNGVGVDGLGNLMFVFGQAGGLYGRRYDAVGTPLAAAFPIVPPGVFDPAVAMNASGNVLVAWQEPQITPARGIRGRMFDSTDMPLGDDFQISGPVDGADQQFDPVVAADGAGNFTVLWQRYGNAIYGQGYDGTTGAPRGSEFRASPFMVSVGLPGIAAYGAGSLAMVWSGFFTYQDVNQSDVFLQRNKPDRLIQGQRMSIANGRDGAEKGRKVTVKAKEKDHPARIADIGLNIDGDPTVAGATLRVIAHGATDSDQTYVLDASGWKIIPEAGGLKSFRYKGPTGADDDPVRRVVLRRSFFGTASLTVAIKGSVGTQDLEVVPPNPGDDGGVILQIGGGGGTYCAAFGGAAGGLEVRDTAKVWKVSKSLVQPGCPTP